MANDAVQNLSSLDWQAFLGSGFCLRWNEAYWLLGLGRAENSDEPVNESPQLYAPDFFLEESGQWRSFQKLVLVSHEVMCERFSPSEFKLGLPWQEPEFEDFNKQVHIIEKPVFSRPNKKSCPLSFCKVSASNEPRN